MAKNHDTKITDIGVALAVIAHEAVPCFCGTEQEQSNQLVQLASCTGGVFWGTSGERWPTSADGQPLIPWLQIVCSEMNGLWGAFYKKKAVCFYIRPDFTGYESTSSDDRNDFVVREYLLDDALVPLDRPTTLAACPFHRVTWDKVQDFPSVGKYHGLFDEAVYTAVCEMTNFTSANRSGIKIGGWPTPLQSDQEYPGSYDLQIDMTENFMYGDSGIGYLSRNGGSWYVIFECC